MDGCEIRFGRPLLKGEDTMSIAMAEKTKRSFCHAVNFLTNWDCMTPKNQECE
jgi:hypothetical protein